MTGWGVGLGAAGPSGPPTKVEILGVKMPVAPMPGVPHLALPCSPLAQGLAHRAQAGRYPEGSGLWPQGA